MAVLAAQVRQVRAGRLLLTMWCGVAYALGWCAAGALFAASLFPVAVKTGWQDARAAQAPGRKRA